MPAVAIVVMPDVAIVFMPAVTRSHRMPIGYLLMPVVAIVVAD